MLTILSLRIKRLRENFPILLGITAMAFALIAVFGAAVSGEYHPSVYIVDEQQTEQSKLFINDLKDNDIFTIDELNKEEAIKKLKDNKGIGLVIIKKNFLQSKEDGLTIMRVNQSREYYTLLQLLQSKDSRYQHKISFSNKIKQELKTYDMTYNDKDIQDTINEKMKQSYNSKAYINSPSYLNGEESKDAMLKYQIIGFTIFFSMYSMVFGIGEIVEEKRLRVYHRQLVSTLSNTQIIFGNLIYTFIIGFVQVSGMIIAGQYLFGIDWGDNLSVIILMAAAFVFCVTCLGLFMSSFVKSMQQLGAVSPIVLTSTAMLGGCMWPLDMINNKALILISNLTPQKWVIDTLNKIINYNQSANIAIIPICVLLGMGCLYLIIGIRRIKVTI